MSPQPLSKLVLSSPRMLKERVGQGRTYIVPLQNDLDLTATVIASDEVTHRVVEAVWYALTV